jgi:hypothetical protein
MGLKNCTLAFSLLVFFVTGSSAQMNFMSSVKEPILEPTLFADGVISTGDYEVSEDFAPDGKTLYFVKSSPDMNFWTLVFSQYEKGKWTEPKVTSFSGQYSDADPFVTDDGKRMLFISRRPLDGSSDMKSKDLDIWEVEKMPNGDWSKPRNLGPTVNSNQSEYFPTLAKDGTLYFGSRRAGGKGGVDLYRSRLVNGKYAEPENLGDAVNTEFDEFEPFIAPDESYMIFMAGGRPDGLGGFDLFVSYNKDGKWSKAENLGAPINSPADELSARITRDGKYFFWTSARSDFGTWPPTLATGDVFKRLRSSRNGLGDIYYISVSALKLKS